MNKPNAKDACIKICEAIWSCRDDEQKDGCYKMLENYKVSYGDDNVGITFIQIEIARLEKMIEKMKERTEAMSRTQEALRDQGKNAGNPNAPNKENTIPKIDTTKEKIVAENGKAKVVPINTKTKK